MKAAWITLCIITCFSVQLWSQHSVTNINRGFIPNKGQYGNRNWQSDKQVLYSYSANPFYIFFDESGVTYRLDKIIKNPKRDEQGETKRTNKSELVIIDFVNANENIEIVHTDPISNYFNFAMKDVKSGEAYSINKVPGYKKLLYKNVWNNIDIEYSIHPENGVKYNVILHPGANPNDVKFDYSSAHTNVIDEKVSINLRNSQLQIETSLGQIIEHAPRTYYEWNRSPISSSYKFENDVLSFNVENYDNTQTVIIDPWVVSPTFNSSTAAWEVETDASSNAYVIGGETPMELWKYNSAGALQWTYTTPWDTSTVWLGTLATDASGNSFVTSGVTAEMHKVNSAGGFVWQTALSGGLQYNSEWWSITFNCDETKLITGGTWVNGIFSFDFYAGIFEIDVATGAVLSDQTVDQTNIGGFGATPIEVRSITSSKNAKYIFLTHHDVGAINENFGSCPSSEPVFQVDNGNHLGYKCENYLPATQNGGGLKALTSNDNYFYTHTGNQIHQWDVNNGNLLNTATIPGGVSVNDFFGNKVVHCSGLDVDDCGNVYAGSVNQVAKFDQNLNLLGTAATTFTVYDVSVSANGEVLACGAQQNNSQTNRNGRVEAINFSACSQYALICCDANFCNPGNLCVYDAPIALVPFTGGGTWSGTAVDASGNFDPALAGVGIHTITYTLACGSSSVDISVLACDLTVCEETNGDLTASGGDGTYTWYEEQTTTETVFLFSEEECIACPTANPNYIFGIYFGCDQITCDVPNTTWVQYATGTTTSAPASYPIMIESGTGESIIINNAGELVACSGCSITPTASIVSNPSTCGAADGIIQICGLTASTTYDDLSYDDGSGTVSLGSFTTDGSGCYQITGLGADSYSNFTVTSGVCVGSDAGPISLSDPGGPVINSITPTDPTCNGACDGSITVSVSGGTPPYSYQWYDGLGNPVGTDSPTLSNICADDYSVEVTDNSGGGGPVQLFYDDFDGGTGQWTMNVPMAAEGADPNYFEMDNDEGGVAPGGCGVAGGNATLHVTSVFFPGGGAAYDAGGLCGFFFCPEAHRQCETVNISSVGQTGLTLNFDYIANGQPGFDYGSVWYNDGSGWTQLGANLSTPVCGGGQGLWTAYSQALPASCENISNLQIAIRWDNNDDGVGTDPSLAINNLEVVSAGGGGGSCTSTAATTLNDPAAITPTASMVQNPTVCGATDGIIQVCGLSASTTYDDLSYDDGSGTVSLGSITTNGSGCYQITGLGADSYSNFVVTLSGCSGTDASTINLIDPAGPAPTASMVQNPTVCGGNDGIIQICGLSASTTYDNLSYDDGTGTVSLGSVTTNGSGCYQITGLAADSYSNFIVTLSGCSGLDVGPIVLTDPAGPTPTASFVQDPTTCGGNEGIIQVCGLAASTTYDDLSYNDGSGTISLGSITTNGSGCYQITGLSADSYSNFVVTLGGCSGTDATSIALSDPGAPAPTASLTQNPLTCGGNEGIITICGLTASTTYDDLSYNDGTGTISLGSFTTNGSGCYQITGLIADSYSNFTVTLAGCTGSDAGPIVLSDPSGPIPAASVVQDPSCSGNDGIIQVCGLTPSTSYDDLSYDDGSGTISLGSITTNGSGCYQITGLAGDTYSNFVITLSGCSGSDAGPLTLTDPGNISVTASVVQNPTACGASDGIIQVCGLNPSSTYDDLSYDDGSGTVVLGSITTDGSGCYQITGLAADSYSNFVVTLSGCTGSDAGPLALSDPGGPSIDSYNTVDPSCAGACDGSITVNVSGGTPPYSYQWYDGLGNPVGTDSPTLSNVCADSYSVEVSDAGGGGGPVQLFYDDFQSGSGQWTMNVTMAAEGTDPNYFEMDDDEGGVAPTGCGVANNGDITLHVTSVFFPDGGAAYDAGGLCGFLFCPEAHRQCETVNINTVGSTGLTLNFDFIANGQPGFDYGSVWFNDGSGWTQLGANLSSPVCGSGQGQWTAYSQALPASCENIPNLQIAIRWDNNDDGVGTDPSLAVNNLEVTASAGGGGGCLAVGAATLTDPATIAPVASVIQDPTSCGASDGIIQICGLTASTTYDDISYNDGSGVVNIGSITTNGSGCYQITGLGGGTYTDFIVTLGSCTGTDAGPLTLNDPGAITFSVSASTNPTSCGSSDGTIQICGLDPSSTYDNLTYLLNSVLTTEGSFTTDASGCYTITGLAVGTYTTFVVTLGSCSGTVNTTVTLSAAGGPAITVDSAISPTCSGGSDGSIAITASGGTAPYTYTWSPNIGSGPGGSNLPAGTYVVTVTDNAGCSSSDTIVLNSPGAIILNETITDMNCGSQNGSINVTVSGGTGPFSYSWTPNGETTPSLNGLAPGNYAVTVTDVNGCTTTESYTVNLIGGLNVVATPDTATYITGETPVQITTTGADTYTWTPSDGLSCSDCPNPEASPTTTTMYVVTGTDAFGCTGTDTVYITVTTICGEFFIPNIFSPNDDYNNDELCVFGNCISEYQLRIFDRWGELVYTSDDPAECWDGKFRGKPMMTGTYTYQLYVEDFSGNIIDKTGSITLVK